VRHNWLNAGTEAKMNLLIPRPRTLIILVAGAIGLLFDELSGDVNLNGEPDDLTQISGIGPAFASRLNDGGITTFAQLAELSPQQVREIAHLSEHQGEPEVWIAQAEELG